MKIELYPIEKINEERFNLFINDVYIKIVDAEEDKGLKVLRFSVNENETVKQKPPFNAAEIEVIEKALGEFQAKVVYNTLVTLTNYKHTNFPVSASTKPQFPVPSK